MTLILIPAFRWMCGPPSGTEKAVVVTAFAIHGGKDCSREAAVIRRSRKGCGPQGGERGRVAQDVLASPRSGPLPPLPQQEGLFLALSLYRKDAVLKFNRRPSTKTRTLDITLMFAASPSCLVGSIVFRLRNPFLFPRPSPACLPLPGEALG